MSDLNREQVYCPECLLGPESVDRRDFMRVAGGTAAVVAGGAVAGAAPALATPPERQPRRPRPAEALIRELHANLSAEQRRSVVYAYDHRQNRNSELTRRRMYNGAFARNIGQVYTRPQQELIERILRAISNGEEGYRKMTRNGTFDRSRNMQACGAYIFGDPTTQQYAWVFQGHHLTVRCDGNSEPGAAFGGPIYYGHSPHGFDRRRNVFAYQAESSRRVYNALSGAQRIQATVTGTPGEHAQSVRFRNRNQHPGLSASDMTRDQRQLVERLMRDVLSPYRQEDADEVMQIMRQNGGLERMRMAFYGVRQDDNGPEWRFWRIEGPGFIWNFRALPHVHTYVNISSRHGTT